MAGLRAARRTSTSLAIIRAAMELLKGRHFSDVSVDEIAAAAGVGRRTFFRYFPTKEDIFLDRRRLDRDFALAEVRSRRPGEDDISLVMRVLSEVQRRGFAMFDAEHQRELHRLTHFEPQLAARSWLLMEDMRDLLVGALVGDGSWEALLRVRLLVSACIMAVDCAITTWIEEGMRQDLGTLLATGEDHLRRGFAVRSDWVN